MRARDYTESELENAVKNAQVFIRNEFGNAFNYSPDYTKLQKLDIVVGVSEFNVSSEIGYIAKRISEKVSCRLLYFPGKHNCPFELPMEFACMAAGYLSIKRDYTISYV